MGREHIVKVALNDGELEQLDELRGGIPRAVWLRQAVQRPPEAADVASREESLAILTSMARDGRVTAAVALARELSGHQPGARESDPLAPLDEILRTKANGP